MSWFNLYGLIFVIVIMIPNTIFAYTHKDGFENKYHNGSYYVNSGTWVDYNTDYPDATRTFVVITTCEQDEIELLSYEESSGLWDISTYVNQ